MADGATTLPEGAIDALVRAAPAGASHEGFSAGRNDDGYALSVDGEQATGLSESAFRAAAARHPAPVAEWYFWSQRAPQTASRLSFLAWVEGADGRSPRAHRRALAAGVTRTWGQLRVMVTLAEDGTRTYDLRHAADADVSVADLTAYADPDDLHEITRHDAEGRYRPLKSAPTLRRGWVYPALDAAAFARAVDAVYPASVANWYRERQGDLDVTHWRETAARQTGIYDVVDELSGEAVEHLAAACCADSQCLKRREWDESADEPLDVPRGDGEFPCREPCSLVVAAAREVALAEREDATESLSLTPAERDQLERVLAAVAAGETDDVRDGDLGDGANRLRVRYLREKLFDDGR